MLGNILNSPYVQYARQALDGLSAREEAIASNIANIDTPGYQRKVVTFENALKAEIEANGGSANPGASGTGAPVANASTPLPLKITDPRQIANPTTTAADSFGGIGGVQGQTVIASKNDGNTVNIDQEMTNLVDTQLRYQALTQSLGTRLATLKTVITG